MPKDSEKYFTCIIVFNPHNNPVRQGLGFSPVFK